MLKPGCAWYVEERFAPVIADLLSGRDTPRLQALAVAEERARATAGATALVPVIGVLTPRGSPWGSSVEGVAASVERFSRDSTVKRIVLAVDSPGGEVAGVAEAAQAIRDARSRKPVVAVASHLAASAAYYLASLASEVVASPSAEVGSVGVIALLPDLSGALAKEGIVVRTFRSPARKGEFSPFETPSEDAQARLRAVAEDYRARFEADVAAGRGVPVERVRATYGAGRLIALEGRARGRHGGPDRDARRSARGHGRGGAAQRRAGADVRRRSP